MTYPAIIVDENGDQTAGNTIEFTDPDNQPAASGPGGGPSAPYTPAAAGADVVAVQNTSDQGVLDYDETTNQLNVGFNGTGSSLHVNAAIVGKGVTASSGFTAGDNSNFGNKNVTNIKNLQAGGTVIFGGLPTSDPAVAGELWNNLGIVTVSAG